MKYDNEVGALGLVRESPAERFHLPVEALRNEELLAVLIGYSVEKAREVIEQNTLATLANSNYNELTQLISRKRARILLSTFELSRRVFEKGPVSISAIREGFRIMSAYTINDTKLWVITEADRRSTTILLPEEY